jgi:hypothetical protein
MEAYLGPLARLAKRLVTAMRMSHWQIPYWMGQMLVIARKQE